MNTEQQISILFQFLGLLIGLAIILLSVNVITRVIRWFWRGFYAFAIAWLSRNMPKTLEQLNRIGIK